MGDDYAMPIMQLYNACLFPWNYIEPIKQSFFKSYFSKGKFMPQVLTVPAKIVLPVLLQNKAIKNPFNWSKILILD